MGDLSSYDQKVCSDLVDLQRITQELRLLGKKIVLTSGTFDILHVGHGRYLSLARKLGDILVVGVDSDEKVRARKGPHRPVVDEHERAEMLSYLAAVDHIYIKRLVDIKWSLIMAVRPDILVISKRSQYTDEETVRLQEYCGSVVVLESQAETSTTARIRSLIISSLSPLLGKFQELQQLIGLINDKLKEITGDQT